MAVRLQIQDLGAMLVLMGVGSSLVMDDRDCVTGTAPISCLCIASDACMIYPPGPEQNVPVKVSRNGSATALIRVNALTHGFAPRFRNVKPDRPHKYGLFPFRELDGDQCNKVVIVLTCLDTIFTCGPRTWS